MNEPIFQLSVEQYHDLIKRGTLTADDPVELLEGVLVFKMPKNRPHALTTGRLSDVFTAQLPPGWHLESQEPITLSDGEPEPDGAVVRGTRDAYPLTHPTPPDLALVIEASDSTLGRDRGPKLRSYARAGIVCYWIVNLIDRQIEVYSEPVLSGEVPTYQKSEIFKPGSSIPLVLDGKPVTAVPVDDILPPSL